MYTVATTATENTAGIYQVGLTVASFANGTAVLVSLITLKVTDEEDVLHFSDAEPNVYGA